MCEIFIIIISILSLPVCKPFLVLKWLYSRESGCKRDGKRVIKQRSRLRKTTKFNSLQVSKCIEFYEFWVWVNCLIIKKDLRVSPGEVGSLPGLWAHKNIKIFKKLGFYTVPFVWKTHLITFFLASLSHSAPFPPIYTFIFQYLLGAVSSMQPSLTPPHFPLCNASIRCSL